MGDNHFHGHGQRRPFTASHTSQPTIRTVTHRRQGAIIWLMTRNPQHWAVELMLLVLQYCDLIKLGVDFFEVPCTVKGGTKSGGGGQSPAPGHRGRRTGRRRRTGPPPPRSPGPVPRYPRPTAPSAAGRLSSNFFRRGGLALSR